MYARIFRRNKNVMVSSLLEHTFCGSDRNIMNLIMYVLLISINVLEVWWQQAK